MRNIESDEMPMTDDEDECFVCKDVVTVRKIVYSTEASVLKINGCSEQWITTEDHLEICCPCA